MRLNLRVWNSTGQVYLDLFKDDPVNVNRQFSDVQLNKPSGSFSQTFRLPATQKNSDFFTEYHEVNTNGDFNAKVKTRAELESDTISIIRGYLQLKAVYIEKGKPEYEVVLFGETADFFREVGDKKMVDLDLSGYDHELGYQNVAQSWDGLLFSGDIRYALIDKGRGWAADGTGRPINDEDYPIYAGDFTPAIRVRALVNQIFEDAGFSYTSNFLDSSYFDNIYVPCFNGELWPIAAEPPESIGFNVGLSSLENVTTSQGFYQFQNTSDSGNFWDTGSDFTVGADDYWTVPYDGVFTIKGWVSGFNDFAFEDEFIIRWTKNGNNLVGQGTYTVQGDSNFNFVTAGIQVDLDQGDLIRFGVYFPNSNANRDIDFNGGSEPDQNGGTGWTLEAATAPYQGVDLDISNNLPDIKQKDFLSGLQKMFNLVFVPNINNPKELTIEPYAEYVGTGATLDWTRKIDTSKTITVKPTSEIQKREYRWEYAVGKDILSKFYAENYEDGKYGNYELEDVENDFATGSETVKVPFASCPCAYIAGTDIVIPKLHDSNFTPIQEPKLRVLYYGGQIDCTALGVFDDALGTFSEITEYPYFGHYSNPVAEVDGEDLNFHIEFPQHTINGNPVNNLYTKYWRDYVNEYYSVEARLMEAFFDLDVIDFYQTEFKDRVFIKDSYWRVLKIDSFQPTADELTKVTLIKELKTPRSCEHIPTGLTNGNEVVFEDSAGSTTVGSQECCELFGYTWSTAQGRCYATQTPTGGIGSQFGENTRNSRRNISMGVNTIEAGTIESVVSGVRINTGENNPYSTFVARNADAVDGLGSVQVFGDDVYAWAKGFHLGSAGFGGLGSKQSGFIPLGGSGAFSGTIAIGTLTIPSNTVIGYKVSVIVGEWNVATSRYVTMQRVEYAGTVHNDGAGLTTTSLTLIDSNGDHASGAITITAGTSGSDLTVNCNNVSATISNNVQIAGVFEYVMTRH